MPWYNTSTVSVTNNSATVTGAATAWVANAAAGMGFVGPDFGLYEIQSVNSDTSLTLAKVYRGSTASGQSYALMPTQDYIRTLASQVATLISTYSTIATAAGAGKFGDGTAASPGITFGANTNTGFYRPSANALGLATNGVAAVVVDGSQNVGVGTTGPAARLHVKSNGQTAIIEGTTARGGGNVYASFNDPTGRKGYFGYGGADDNFYVANEMNAAMLFVINSTERMRLDANGNQINIPSNTPPTLTINGQMNLTPTSNANIRISYRGSDGVTRVGNITLA